MVADADNDDSRLASPANGADEGSEEGTEYEIELILDAKRGMFPDGRIGYYVKWKGYTEEDNSWVDENDAGNAEELIKEYWRKKKRRQDSKGKRGRKSTAPDEESDTGSVSGAPKKRGRKAQPRADSEGSEEIDARFSKKARMDTTHKTQENDIAIQDDDQIVIIGDMTKHSSLPSWEEIIETIDTVEKDETGKIMVFFTLKTGERVRESSELCRKRCPQKLITFFENHLKWKEAEVEDEII